MIVSKDLKLLDIDKSMLSYTITLFNKYSNVDKDSELFQDYKDYAVPTIIKNVYYERAKNFQGGTGATEVGDYSLWILLNQSKFIRNIKSEEYGWIEKEVEYIDYTEYINKGFDEQAERYFTVNPQNTTFILGRNYRYEQTLKVPNKEITKNELLKYGLIHHTVKSVDIQGLNPNKPYVLNVIGAI